MTDAISQGMKSGQIRAKLSFFEMAIRGLAAGCRSLSSGFTMTQMVWTLWYLWRSRPAADAYTAATLAAARLFTSRADRPNLFIKIPGTSEGPPAIDRSNLCRRTCQRNTAVLGASNNVAACRGISTRHRTAHRGRAKSDVGSVASLFASRWDVAGCG